MVTDTPTYSVHKQSEGVYHVVDADGDCIARIRRFNMPDPMISVASGLYLPAGARAVASAMTRSADDLDREAAVA